MLIPFGEAYREDRNSGFGKYQLIRVGERAYSFSKVFVLLIGLTLVALISYILIFSSLGAIYPLVFGDGIYHYYNKVFPIFSLELTRPLGLILILSSFDILYLIFLCMGSFTISLYLKNRIMLYMGPSLIFAFSGRIGGIFFETLGLTSLFNYSRGVLNLGSLGPSILASYATLLVPIGLLALISYKKILKEVSSE